MALSNTGLAYERVHQHWRQRYLVGMADPVMRANGRQHLLAYRRNPAPDPVGS